jgi:hypothetical protein
MKLLPLELSVLTKLLDGHSASLQVLRLQLQSCSVVQRQSTGCGFYTTLSVPDDIERVSNLTATFGDVVANIAGLKNGAGFLLFIKDGALDMLEGFSFDEPWPSNTSMFTLNYSNEGARDWGDLGDQSQS